MRSFLGTFFIKHKTLKFLTTLILLLHSYVGIVTIQDEFGDDYAFFIKKEFTTQVMFYAPLVMRDDAPEVSNDEVEKMSNFVKS